MSSSESDRFWVVLLGIGIALAVGGAVVYSDVYSKFNDPAWLYTSIGLIVGGVALAIFSGLKLADIL